MMRSTPALTLLFAWFTPSHSFPVNRVFVSTPSQTLQGRLVEDCMTPNPICLRTSDSVNDAIQELLLLGFNGAPVLDANSNQFVGMISAFDFLQKEEGGTLLPIVQDGNPQEIHQNVEAVRKICARTVGDLMTRQSVTLNPSMTMREASEIMLRDRCHRLGVVDEDGSLIGILASSDIMRHIVTVAELIMPESSYEENNGEEESYSSNLAP